MRRRTTTSRIHRAIFPILGVLLVLFTSPGAMASSSVQVLPDDQALEIPTTTPIKHLVTIMQSNHSFDSLFGVYPGADGIPEGTCIPTDPDAVASAASDCVKPFPMANNGADFDHTHRTFRNQYRDGRNDGFLSSFRKRGEDGTLAIGHYTAEDIPFSYNAAEQYVLFDRFFTSASAGSVPNRMYWTTGQPGISNFDDTAIPREGWGDLPTIFDELQARGISWKFYIEHYDPTRTYRNRGIESTYAQVNWAPVLTFQRFIDDPELNSHIVDLDQYYVDLEKNQLPAVSYVVTVGSSGHPPSSLVASERFLQSMVNALMMSPAWDTSVIQWAYDDWGGWYDHVPPPQIDEFGYGYRTAAQLVSPYARKGYIDSETHDFTSILAFIEDNWSIPALAERDANAVSIATALDFSQPPRAASIIPMDQEAVALVIPNRTGIHISYSVAILSAGVVLVGSLFRRKDKKGRRP